MHGFYTVSARSVLSMSDDVGRCIALQSVPFFASGEQCQVEFCLHFRVGMLDLLLAFHRLLFGGKALPFVAALAVLVLIGVLFFNFLLKFSIAVVMIRAGIECAKVCRAKISPAKQAVSHSPKSWISTVFIVQNLPVLSKQQSYMTHRFYGRV